MKTKSKQKKQSVNERLKDTILEMATSLYNIGEIDAVTMREFETINAPEVKELKANEIKRIRMKAKVSQVVFAKLLNISPETIRKWEQGDRHPTGSSLKLLNLVSTHGLEALY